MTNEMDSPEENPADGLFSYAGEWHAFLHGVREGIASVAPGKAGKHLSKIDPKGLPEGKDKEMIMRQLRQESWYVTGGILFGYLIGIVVYVFVLGSVSLSGIAPL